MPRSKQVAMIPEANEPIEEEEQIVEKRRTRRMTPEALDKLRLAREKAIEARKKSGQVNRELLEIRQEIKKEKLGDRVDEVETYHKLKQKVEDEVKANEIVHINKKLDDMYNRFNGFLEDREIRKREKALRKQDKTAKQIAHELPAVVSKQMLEQQLKEREMAIFRRNVFGI